MMKPSDTASTLGSDRCKASEPIHQVCPKTRERRSHRTKTSRSIGIHNSLRPNRHAPAHKQHHPGQTEIHNHHLLVKISTSTHPPPGGYMYPPPPPPPQQHIPQLSQIMVQQDPDTAAALQQMAQVHQQHFKTSQNQTKALENIISASPFTSTVGCIPIYNGKDKDACTEWLQRCKEVSYYTGYNFRSALLQRSSQDVARGHLIIG